MLDINACDGRWPSILTALGVPPEVLNRRNQPCPFCGGVDRFRFIDHNGWGTWVCNACQPNPTNGFAFVQRWIHGGASQAARKIEEVLPSAVKERVRKAENKRPEMRAKWEAAERVTREDPVWRYLSNRSVSIWPVPSDIRYAKSEPYYDNGQQIGAFPAMYALVRDTEGRGQTLHVTYLTDDGKKADVPSPRKILSSTGNGSAIRLYVPGWQLAVTEGVETALAVHALFAVPVWATMSAGNMVKWRPPHGVDKVLIYGDTDSSFTGQRAAYELAFELKRAGLDVEVNLLDEMDTDYADLLA